MDRGAERTDWGDDTIGYGGISNGDGDCEDGCYVLGMGARDGGGWVIEPGAGGQDGWSGDVEVVENFPQRQY